jgi:DTW domain-containing protein YfiP
MVPQDSCYCDKVTKLDLLTKLSIVLFKKEQFLTSNTAKLSLKSLSNSQFFYRGYQDTLLQAKFIDEENYQPLYLFPSEGAIPLTLEYTSQFDKPINLIVPDGTWRQAKKVHTREPLLSNIPVVKICSTQKSIYPLRRQKYEYGLCTHEAVAYALEIIESVKIKDTLIENLNYMVEAHLKSRVIFEKEKGPKRPLE